RTDRQFAGARDHRARIWVDPGCAILRPSGPCSAGNAAIGAAPRQLDPGRAKPDPFREHERKHGSGEQTRAWSDSVAVPATCVAQVALRPHSPRVGPGGRSDAHATVPCGRAVVLSEDLVGSPRATSARVASSIRRSTRTSASAPRLVRTEFGRLAGAGASDSLSFLFSATTGRADGACGPRPGMGLSSIPWWA